MRREGSRILPHGLLVADLVFLFVVAIDVVLMDVLGLRVWVPVYVLLMVLHLFLLLRRGGKEAVWVVESDPQDEAPNPRTVIPRGGT